MVPVRLMYAYIGNFHGSAAKIRLRAAAGGGAGRHRHHLPPAQPLGPLFGERNRVFYEIMLY